MSSPRLCVTVAAPTTAELRLRRDEAREADLVELRLDAVADPDVAGALAGRPGQVLVTCRPRWEGGAFRGSEEERLRILSDALAQGADYVDVEFRALQASPGFRDLVAAHKNRVVLSMHDFGGVPADLAEQVRDMRATGAAVVKAAVMTQALADNLKLLALRDSESRSVFVGMGQAGLPTRVLAARFGSAWTYAGDGHAPGQIPAAEMLEQYRFKEIGAETEIYGVVGKPVGHSASPAMHNAVFKTFGRNAVYLPLEAASAADFLAFADALKLRGASVTIPYKIDFFDAIVERGRDITLKIGALNTLKREADGWHGRNTDHAGFTHSLMNQHGVNPKGKRVAVLGAGGSARAVVYALHGISRVTVHARNQQRAAELATLFPSIHVAGPDVLPGSWDLLVNTTPVGMSPRVEETPLPSARFDGEAVFDLVYNPVETRLLREAGAAGLKTIGGLDMLVGQALHQWAWWTDVSSSGNAQMWNRAFEIMKQAAMNRLGISHDATVPQA